MTPGSWDEETLARRCAVREEAAWRELLRRAGGVAQGVLQRVFLRAGVPDPAAEAAEAMGDLALELLRNDGALLKAYRPSTPLSVYLAVVARSVAIKSLRKRRPSLSLERAGEGAAWTDPEIPQDPERMRLAMDRLAPRDRLLLQLVYWEGLGYAQAAGILGVQPSSLGPLLTRARSDLKRILSESETAVRIPAPPGY